MSKRSERKAGKTVLRCAPVRLMSAVADGEPVPEKVLVERAGYLIEIAARLAEQALAAHWNQADMDLFLADGQPSFAWKAMGQTFGWPSLAKLASYAPSRVGHMALEAAGRTLRSSDFRRHILAALIAGTDLPPKADAVSIRNLERALENYKKREGRDAASLFELEPNHPKVARQALLAATDDQVCRLSRSEIAILLPVVADPVFREDWVWHIIPYRQPKHLRGAACRPTLRVVGKRLIADMPFEKGAVCPISLTPCRVIGYDWGVNTPLVGTLAWLEGGKPFTDGREIRFAADGLLNEIYDLADHTEELSDKIALFSEFLRVPPETEPNAVKSKNPLAKDRAVLWLERQRVSHRYNKLLDELAHLVSRWAVEQALACHADTIVMEDLRTLEPKLGRKQNRRMTLGMKGKILEFIIYKAAEEGIRVSLVNPRGTSSLCPRCGGKTRHYKSSDSKKSGYRWMRCPDCGLSLDRDNAGSEGIAGRGLAPEAPLVTRVVTPKLSPLDPRTLPARGPVARRKRELYETLCASSAATPAPAGSLNALSGHRPLEAGSKDPQSGLQAGTTSDLANGFRQPRTLDGLRSAYLGLVACSPIRAHSTA